MNNLQNKQFVMTGELKQMKREEAEDLIRAAGGSISETLTINTDFIFDSNLSIGDLMKSTFLNIIIVNEQEFISLLEGKWKPSVKEQYFLNRVGRLFVYALFGCLFMFFMLKHSLALNSYSILSFRPVQRFILWILTKLGY